MLSSKHNKPYPRRAKSALTKANERVRYQQRKADGLCVWCAKGPSQEGKVSCTACSAVRNASFEKRRQEVGPWSRLLSGVKSRAKSKNLTFDLDIPWLEDRKDKCSLTNIPFDLQKMHGVRCNPFGPSVDRITPSLGYIKDNCRVVLYGINAALNEWGTDNFKIMAQAYLSRAA